MCRQRNVSAMTAATKPTVASQLTIPMNSSDIRPTPPAVSNSADTKEGTESASVKKEPPGFPGEARRLPDDRVQPLVAPGALDCRSSGKPPVNPLAMPTTRRTPRLSRSSRLTALSLNATVDQRQVWRYP
jgi:hypothetical protein